MLSCAPFSRSALCGNFLELLAHCLRLLAHHLFLNRSFENLEELAVFFAGSPRDDDWPIPFPVRVDPSVLQECSLDVLRFLPFWPIYFWSDRFWFFWFILVSESERTITLIDSGVLPETISFRTPVSFFYSNHCFYIPFCISIPCKLITFL